MEAMELLSPLPFALLTLAFASLVGTVSDVGLGMDKPFFRDHSYYAHYRTYGLWLTTIQKILPPLFSASIVLRSLKFALVVLVVVLWARSVGGTARKYWADVAAFSYLLPFVLITEIIEQCAVNLSFRIMGDHVLLFLGAVSLIMILSAFIIYGMVLKIVDQVYGTKGWRRVLHVTGYLVVVPVLLFVLNVAFYLGPVGLHAYAVIRPMMEGDAKLDKGDYEGAEKLFLKAIKNDATGVWSIHAHILLISASARRILALLPAILGDSGIRERMRRNLAQTDPFRQMINAFRLVGSGNLPPAQLIEFREAILRSFLDAGDIPVTNSELDCALRSTAADEGCDELPKEALTLKANTPTQRQRLSYLIYRGRALRAEPTTTDARRYSQFLLELPIRIEMMFVRYRALNLARDSKTLAYLDDLCRNGCLDRESLIKGNRDVRDHGYKFGSVRISQRVSG